MRPGFDQYRKVAFTVIYLTAALLVAPSGCPPGFLLSVKLVAGRCKLHLFVGQSFHSIAAPRCTAERFTTESHSSLQSCIRHTCGPVNHFHADLSGEKRGGGGSITPYVISMALLANRIGVNKLELFLRDVECCPVGCCVKCVCSSGCDGRRAGPTVA